MRRLSFGTKIAGSFAVMAILVVLICAAAMFTLYQQKTFGQRVEASFLRLNRIAQLSAAHERRIKNIQSYVLTSEAMFAEEIHGDDTEVSALLEKVGGTLGDAVQEERHRGIMALNAEVHALLGSLMAEPEPGLPGGVEGSPMDHLLRVDREIGAHIKALIEHEQSLVDASFVHLVTGAIRMAIGVPSVAVLVSVIALGLSIVLSRQLTRQLSLAIERVQGSSTELQDAAIRQVDSSKVLAATAVEIASTVCRLTSASHQIAVSARGASQMAEDAGSSADAGDATVKLARSAIEGIRLHASKIVEHMRSLGADSQHIGGIFELIKEFSDQTNILSINAMIEASGAGEAGKRFAAVASEIRRLADRVGESSRQVRGLVEQIRVAAAAAAAISDEGTLAIDAGVTQLGSALDAFRRISERVATTAGAAREIELRVQEHTSSIEQVNRSLVEVAAAAKESESTSVAMLEAFSQLSEVSSGLRSLIHPTGAA